MCNLDGKLSVVHYRGRTLVFMRYNIKGNGWRHVQMTSSPIDSPDDFETFQSLEFAHRQPSRENNVYFFDVQALPDDSALMAIFPATYRRGCCGRGCGRKADACTLEGGVVSGREGLEPITIEGTLSLGPTPRSAVRLAQRRRRALGHAAAAD